MIVNSEDGFTGYITNKRVIFYKKSIFNFKLLDILYTNLQNPANITSQKSINGLMIGIVFVLFGLLLISSTSFGLFMLVVGIFVIVIWSKMASETLNLNTGRDDYTIKADTETLHKMLKREFCIT